LPGGLKNWAIFPGNWVPWVVEPVPKNTFVDWMIKHGYSKRIRLVLLIPERWDFKVGKLFGDLTTVVA